MKQNEEKYIEYYNTHILPRLKPLLGKVVTIGADAVADEKLSSNQAKFISVDYERVQHCGDFLYDFAPYCTIEIDGVEYTVGEHEITANNEDLDYFREARLFLDTIMNREEVENKLTKHLKEKDFTVNQQYLFRFMLGQQFDSILMMEMLKYKLTK